jgi:hypothetical protein
MQASLRLPITVETAAARLHPVLRQQRLDEASDAAYQAGLGALRRVGPFGEMRLVSKAVRVKMLEPRPVKGGLRVQFRWIAAGLSGQLFPALDADLDILAFGDRHCLLSINAVYTPPLGTAGAGIDRLILHRAARATLRSLLHDLGRSLADPDPATRSASEHLGPYSFSPS